MYYEQDYELQVLDTSEEHLETLNCKQLIDLFHEVNDLVFQNRSMDRDDVDYFLEQEFNIIFELSKRLGYYK